MPTPDAARLLAFLAALPSRPDAGRCRGALARAFMEHAAEMQLPAEPSWIADHVDEILGTMGSLFGQAAGGGDDDDSDFPPATEWLQRMSWLPALIADLEAGRARLDA